MTEEEVRQLREALFVLQEQLLRNLMYDALTTERVERLNFFRVYRGAMMDGVVVDWWKIFGNRKDASHWSNLLPEEQHEDFYNETDIALANLAPPEDRKKVWQRIRNFRNTNVAHLNFDEKERARTFPRLAPLRISAEVLYCRLFELLESEGRVEKLPLPKGMRGELRERDLEHYRVMVRVAREALCNFGNVP
ncbi:MAG: hypothetical protein GY947_22940 [Rhodobacteraceae bacterium]|nr:hypothetical protein [Paracoccaceae bacterium]